ncbi:uncharacterized protein K444DRAFT_694259 [Hyaloscypha bicolor E]|uniref:Stc1 domain-containing protein n=1 Tax=Hyaloscypha bicolor E TaxID=1095630 RepID=A0A2J6T0P7_9HELO|nr:uncharacterized protein K444DRAFT_694259 [Hyaloscypha bicolor E]PMD56608.1 hypothetical protein K444DRAFT_694259 [Hyaloscypha bicolor E]
MHTNNPFMPFRKLLILLTILLPVSRRFLIQGITQAYTIPDSPQTTIKMCVRITTWACDCKKEELEECRWYRQAESDARKEKEKRGFWKSIFHSACKIVCPFPAGRIHHQYHICPGCTARREAEEEGLRHRLLRRAERERRRQDGESEARSQKETERRRLETKWGWVCEACRTEGRVVQCYQRKPHDGPCCARGADEFAEWEKIQGYHSSDPRPPSRAPRADPPREPRATRENMFSHPKIDDKGARDNRRDPDNESLEPHLVAAVGLMSGMNPRFMGTDPSPPPLPPPQPYYENPGIDLDRWGGARRTDHGSYPAPSAPPDDPLPWKPLRTKHSQVKTVPATRSTPANFSRPAEAPRNRSVRREPSLPPRPQLRHENRKISGLTAPSTPLRKPVAASGSSKKNVATSGSSKSSKTFKKATPTSPQSNSSKKTASNPPTSMKEPTPTGSRYHTKALQDGRRLSRTSSRGPPIPTPDGNGISPFSSPVSNNSSVSSMSSHPLRSVGSTMGELYLEIDDMMDCFSEPDEDPPARRWH